MKTKHTSRIPKFYKKTLKERINSISKWANIPPQKITTELTPIQANNMIENAIGTYNIPLGIATNFLINNKNYLIPMAIEEPSVVAAASNAARLFREGNGFTTSSDEPIMIGQIQVTNIPNLQTATNAILNNRNTLLTEANKVDKVITKLGGGARDIQIRSIENTPTGPMLIIHLLYDTRDAMGANSINTATEHLTPHIEAITHGQVNLRILSNLADQRKAYAEGMIPASKLAQSTLSGQEVIKSILKAAAFAEIDPYRATTHNKGIMNGIDAVVIATGNDWRAVEAGAHAYAARSGSYTSLTKWWQDENGNLRGSIELPLAVGIVGGATRVHPTAQLALHILGVESARELSEVIAAVGLAQNLAAIRALATEGIQHGHMRLHARQLAIAAGAPDNLVTHIAKAMADEGNIRLERAEELVKELQEDS